MDTKDLRIGDFVYYLNEKWKIIEITRKQVIICKENLRKCGYTDISDIKPIPITDDLLKTIGAKLIEGIYYLDNGQIAIQVEINHIWNLSINKGIQDYEKKICYLHQLQHELYEVGVDIKISLEDKL